MQTRTFGKMFREFWVKFVKILEISRQIFENSRKNFKGILSKIRALFQRY